MNSTRRCRQVPGSTTVETYLRESLGFLSQQPREGEWVAGVRAPGMNGDGRSIGMAFLSGVCATGEGESKSADGHRAASGDAAGAAAREPRAPEAPQGDQGWCCLRVFLRASI